MKAQIGEVFDRLLTRSIAAARLLARWSLKVLFAIGYTALIACWIIITLLWQLTRFAIGTLSAISPHSIWRASLISLIRGQRRGLLVLLLFTAPLMYIALTSAYERLNVWALERVERLSHSLEPDTNVTFAVDYPAVQILRESEGKPILASMPLNGGGGTFLNASYPTQRRLLSRYRARLKRGNKLDVSDAGNKVASTQAATKGAPHDEQYAPDIILVEITLEWNKLNDWRVVADVGYQSAPFVWTRIPWWQKEGIAPSNELIRVEHSQAYPVVWSFATPTTTEAVCAYLKDYFFNTAKTLNPAYASAGPIRLSAKDFERGVVHPFMRVLPADYGNISVLPTVFLFNTCNGPLQALMFACFGAGLILLLVRLVALVEIPTLRLRWYETGRTRSRTVRRLALASDLSPLDAAERWLETDVKVRSQDEIEREIEEAFEINQTGMYIVRQLESWIIYFGLLGTLVYLSLAIMQLRIHPSTAVMQSILASMSVTMAQAFLTTIVSSTLQRIVESAREMTSSKEALFTSALIELVKRHSADRITRAEVRAPAASGVRHVPTFELGSS